MLTVHTDGLLKIFGSFTALDGLNLDVEEGTIFGFLGPNGAGKTTTIRILTGLAHASGGKAWVNGVEVGTNHNKIARQIGFLPEEPAFYTWMNPREFLDYVGQVFRLTAQERLARIDELLTLAGLQESSRRRISGFSRGMRQRLALAQALMNRPSVLFLDEPASALDPEGRKEVLEFIEQLRGKCTVFMSTHILGDVERICDTVGIINRGKLVTAAPRETLLAQYAIPAFEVQVEPQSEAALKGWGESLKNNAWVRSVSIEKLVGRVVVNNVDIAKSEFLPSVLQAGLILTHYEVVKPSLEEVFLHLVGQEEAVR